VPVGVRGGAAGVDAGAGDGVGAGVGDEVSGVGDDVDVPDEVQQPAASTSGSSERASMRRA
jgi:hypothetical protein